MADAHSEPSAGVTTLADLTLRPAAEPLDLGADAMGP
jgi:hypothetical protein